MEHPRLGTGIYEQTRFLVVWHKEHMPVRDGGDRKKGLRYKGKSLLFCLARGHPCLKCL